MAAYAAAISLKNTIQCILQSSRISQVPPSPNILQPAYDVMVRLQKVLLKLEETGYSKIRTKVNALDERIKEVIWEFEDLLESQFTNQILPQLESSGGERGHLSFSVDLQSLRQSVDCFIERVTMMEVEYETELLNMPEEEGEPISSRIDFSGINSKMVGLSNEFEQVKNFLVQERMSKIRSRLSVVGSAGVGKTTLAKKVFDDPSIQRHFELRVWVRVGRKCETNDILRCILAQVDPNTHHQMLAQGDDDDEEKLVGLLEERLKDKKCLIVLDDVWEWDTRLMDSLPEKDVRIFLTSRIKNRKSLFKEVRLLNGEESKKLLGEKVFGEQGFPYRLEKLGEMIARKCEGLPLMIVIVAELLSKEDKTPEYWTEVAKQNSSVFADAYNQILEVLFPSYDYLPQYLKMYFLYLGAYPPYNNIKLHSLFQRLSAEGFLEPIDNGTLEDFVIKCNIDLAAWYDLLQIDLTTESWFSTRSFRVLSCWQHLCKNEASKIKFLHVLQSCDDAMKNQRRLCVHHNILFSSKLVCDTIKSDCASTARSLLFFGPYRQYPMQIHAMDFKLLRVLHALTVRFYHFHPEFLKLVCLKYLSLTCKEELPSSISNLFHLQTLIIRRHLNIKNHGALSYMPIEIWDMQKLQHMEVYGSDLPTPSSDATLDKLSTLYGVSAKSCTREILKRMPNLKDLAIMMEMKPDDDDDDDDDDSNPMSGLDNILEELKNLEILKYYVLNPDMMYESRVPLSMYPSTLTRLYLSA